MPRLKGPTLLMGLLLATGGCSVLRCEPPGWVVGEQTALPGQAAEDRKKTAKTLFQWAVAEKPDAEEDEDGEEDGAAEEKKNGEKQAEGKEKTPAEDNNDSTDTKNGHKGGRKKGQSTGAGKSEEVEEEDVIETDRPDFTEASTTVGRGRTQLETGYTWSQSRFRGTTTNAHSYPEALLRVGVFAEWFELRLGQNFAAEREVEPAGTRLSASGAEDLYLGVKVALTEQERWLPEMALIVQMTVPTGAEAFSADEVLPGMNWLYGWDVVKDCISIGGSTQMNRAHGVHTIPAFQGFPVGTPAPESNVTHSYLELAQSLTVNWTLTSKLGAFTEWFAFFPHSALDPDVGPQHYFDGGFTCKVTNNFQLDIRAGVGLNEHATDYFAGSGFSVRR